uniref:Protein lin-10 n=1 Tax=Haemonchus contortus TaxID=6289 RepID=A0A7I4XWF1_HAECO
FRMMDKMSPPGTASPDNPLTRTSTTPQATHTPPLEPGVPMQFQMPFFANPFMSPFMPQQGVPMDGAAAAGANPAMPAFFFSPAQYQEMMQQYFTQMMTANQYGMNMAFPMPFGTTLVRPCSQASQSDGVGETVNGLHELHISSAADREVVNPSNVTCQSDSPSSSGKNSIASGAERVANEVAADSNRSSSEEQGQGKSPCVDSSSEKVSTKSEGEEACETPKKKFERKSSLPTEDEKTSNLIRKQMSEIEKEITRRSQNKNIKKIDDRELAELFGSSAVAAGLTSAASMSALNEHATFAPNFSSGSNDSQSALPFSAAVNECKPPPKETINQLRSSFNLPEMSTSPAQLQLHMQQSGTNSIPFASPQMAGLPHGMSSPLHTQPMIGAMTQPFPMAQPFPCGQPVIGPFAAAQMPFAAAQFHNRGHNVSHEQLAAAFLPQDQRPSQAEPQSSNSESVTDVTTTSTMSEHVSNVPSGGTIAPPPPPARPVHRRISQSAQPSSSSEWPDENKENGSTEEPVWVLRDSYLKRMQREMKEEEQRDEWNGDANTAASASTTTETPADGEEMETDRLLLSGSTGGSQPPPPSTGHGKKKNSKETMVHEPAVLIEGVLFRARYLGSTQMMCESRGSKAARMAQAQEAVARVKAPEGEIQPSTEIDLFISTEKIMVLNTDLQDILMDHALRTISYIADIGDLVVLMARRMSASSSDEQCNQVDGIKKTPKVICHVFESDEASFIAQSIGQAFQVAYVEFLRANGIDDPSYLRQIDYQEVLNSQELLGDELEMFARKETQKDVVVPKKSGEPLGIVVVESGWGSMLPTVVLAHMNPAGPAARSNQLNIGDQIININGISLVGLPLSAAQTNIKNVKTCTAVRLTVVSTPPVVEVRIRRPDTKYQLGFSVQNGVICSLLRGGIAERGGIRVGHRIIEINNQSVVAVAHDRIVNMLATAIGEIHMKTMPHQYVPPAHRPGHSSVHLIL